MLAQVLNYGGITYKTVFFIWSHFIMEPFTMSGEATGLNGIFSNFFQSNFHALKTSPSFASLSLFCSVYLLLEIMQKHILLNCLDVMQYC